MLDVGGMAAASWPDRAPSTPPPCPIFDSKRYFDTCTEGVVHAGRHRRVHQAPREDSPVVVAAKGRMAENITAADVAVYWRHVTCLTLGRTKAMGGKTGWMRLRSCRPREANHGSQR